MVDKITPEARSRNMAAVSNKNTAPELLVRSALHRLGYRFRLHVKDLPGNPDIVLPRFRTCIFVHGCFWHRHRYCRRSTTPSSNTNFWLSKFEKNIERDKFVKAQLKKLGWKVCVIWECETKSHQKLIDAIAKCHFS